MASTGHDAGRGAGAGCPSDDEPRIRATGQGDVVASVVSMSQRHPEGRDAEYLEWHLLDHLPEQYRLPGLRSGTRWVSTPACRAARLASQGPFDDVDHIVQYLFAEPVAEAFDGFFALGAALRRAGRMPIGLPWVQVGGWDLIGSAAAPRALVGAAVLPWRPATGAYVLVERRRAGHGSSPSDADAFLDVDGVVGHWTWAGATAPHPRLGDTDGLSLTVCYLDQNPLDVAARMGPLLAERWSDPGVSPQLAAPFHAVRAGEWDRSLP